MAAVIKPDHPETVVFGPAVNGDSLGSIHV